MFTKGFRTLYKGVISFQKVFVILKSFAYFSKAFVSVSFR